MIHPFDLTTPETPNPSADEPAPKPYITIASIIAEVCDYYGVTPREICSKSRRRPIVRYRQMACYLAKRLTIRSYPEIGRKIGDRDHSTVIHACRVIDNLIERDADLKGDVEYFVSILTGETDRGESPVDAQARIEMIEREREQRFKEIRREKLKGYLELRRRREMKRLHASLNDDELLSLRIRNYAKQPLEVRMAQ